MAVIHKKSEIKFGIKKGEVHFTQTESYNINGTDDESVDKFKGQCDLSSDKIHEWAQSVVKSWIDGDSIREDAQLPSDS